MKQYSIPRKVWRAISFPLIYLGIQIGVTIIAIFGYSIYLGFKYALNNSLIDTTETQQKIVDFSSDYTTLILLISALICLYIFFFVFKREKKAYNEPRYHINGAGLGISLGVVVSLNLVISMLFLLVDVYKIFPSYKGVSDTLSSGPVILNILCVSIIIPFVEELCFRGITQSRLARSLPVVAVIIIQALIFGIAHLNIFQGMYAFVMGLALGYAYYKYKNILIPIIMHIVFNFIGGAIDTLLSISIFNEHRYLFFIIFIVMLGISVFFLFRHKPQLSEVENKTERGNSIMDNTEIFETQETKESEEVVIKKNHIPTLVLMIIGLVFSILITYVTYVCSTISLVFAIKKRKTNKTTYAIILNIIALVIAIANSILGILIHNGTITL